MIAPDVLPRATSSAHISTLNTSPLILTSGPKGKLDRINFQQGIHITPIYSDILEMTTVMMTMLMGPYCLLLRAGENCQPEAVRHKLGGGWHSESPQVAFRKPDKVVLSFGKSPGQRHN